MRELKMKLCVLMLPLCQRQHDLCCFFAIFDMFAIGH